MLRLRVVCLALAVLCTTFPSPAHAIDPLTVAGAGITTSLLLDRLDEKATNIVQNAGAVGSLLTSKAARDVQLEIMAARQQLHDELNQNWDRLDGEKVSALRAIDSVLEELSKNVAQAGRLEDDLALDVDQQLNKIPFLAKAFTLRRVWGASQYYRPQGLYVISLHGNIFDQSAGTPEVWIGGQHLAAPPLMKPPYDVVLNIPVELINKHFQDRKLSYVDVVVKQKVPNRPYSFQIWRDEYRLADFRFMLELFPRYPAAYRLTEYDIEPTIDTSQVKVWPRREMYIPGCGNSGCNAYYNVCEDVPAGAQPIKAVDFYDSFNGWGGFGQQTVTSTGVCVVYWQHSHNVGRNVGFNVQYYPASSHVVPHDIALAPISSDSLSDYFKGDDPTDTAAAKDKSVTPQTVVDSGPYAIVEGGIDHGAVRLGRTYDAHFSNNMTSFTLVFRTFTGEELILTPGKKSDLLDASPVEDKTSFKRMTVGIKPPW
jgi:hypothetical protein